MNLSLDSEVQTLNSRASSARGDRKVSILNETELFMIFSLVMSLRDDFSRWSHMRCEIHYKDHNMITTGSEHGLTMRLTVGRIVWISCGQCEWPSSRVQWLDVDWPRTGWALKSSGWTSLHEPLCVGRKAGTQQIGLFTTVEQCPLNLRLSIRDRSGGRTWQAGQAWCELNSNLALISTDNLCSRLVILEIAHCSWVPRIKRAVDRRWIGSIGDLRRQRTSR